MITLRPAKLDDSELLLFWRNQPAVRMASHNTQLITRDEHRSWLLASLNNPARKLLIAEENNLAVGTVRADLKVDTWLLSWAVSPNAQGRGVAKRMVALLALQLAIPISAEIKKDNIASIKVAEHVGMAQEGEIDGMLFFKKMH
ncbi:MAG: GNAT family N-acetyltransferase [Marinagarivorans sp.]|nr:GNAT family N-acetyltransferase [Marinagarivorans sp.]